MRTLDTEYITDLTIRAKAGETEAFAELYGITYEKQYTYAFGTLKNKEKALLALKETYKKALSGLNALAKDDAFFSYLLMINFETCLEIMRKKNAAEINVRVDDEHYSLSNLKKLPVTESIVMIERYYRKKRVNSIAGFLEIDSTGVREYLRRGKDHLKKLLQED